MARKHCQVLDADGHAQLASLCSTERSSTVAARMGEEYRFVRSTADYASVLSDPAIDIVFICTPDQNHPGQVISALQSGKHVFCEKPLARTSADFERIGRQLESSGKVLQVGMNCRFREQYAIPKQLVSSGELGALRFLRGTYVINTVEPMRRREKAWWLDYPAGIFPFLHGGGIHSLDLLRWIGGDIESVFARATGFELDAELEADTFSVSIKFASGAIGELLVSASAFRPNDFSLELWLSRGSILGTKVFRRRDDSGSLAQEEITIEQKVMDLGLQFTDMMRAIEFRSEPLNSFAEAYENFRVLQAIHQSIRSGQAVQVRHAVTTEENQS